MSSPLYEIVRLEHFYGDHPVLNVDHLSIPSNSITGIIGPNGSGKSTLLKLLSFAMAPTTGQILFRNRPEAPFSKTVRSRITLLTQEPYLLKRSVYDNIAYGLRIRNDTKECRNRVLEALSWVGLSSEDFARRQWHALSGGEAQRVALAARLVLKPQVLILDEPLASVDAASTQLIKEASLRAREKWGTTLIIASHDQSWLQDNCDTILHLFKGRLIGQGVTNIVFGPWQSRPDGFFEKQLPDRQALRVPRPPSPDAAAIIPPRAFQIVISSTSPGTGDNVLSGIISRLVFENHSKAVIATVMVADHALIVKLPADFQKTLSLHPGQKVKLSYNPKEIHWCE